MKNILDRLIDDFHERDLPIPVTREQNTMSVPGKANAVIGMRRAGKTWFCYQYMRELMKKGIDKERLLYINFEDDRLLPFTGTDFQEILDAYYRKFPAFKSEKCHIFLDEVQNIEGWDRFVRRVLDSENLEVWITGSSSRLLSSEIATSLRGRSISKEIFPFSFKECLLFNDIDLKSTSRFGSRTMATLQHMLDKYMGIGGFPEVQNLDDETRYQIHRNYIDVVILRDVVERYNVRNTVALRSLIRHIMAAPATKFSINRFYNTLKSQSIACTKNDLYLFLDHLADAFLVYPVPIHSRSHKARQVNPKKIYVVDTGLLASVSFKMTEDRGALLENLIYMHLRRQGKAPEYYITKSGAEVDFVIPGDRGQPLELIQVCWSMDSPETRKREEKSLREAMSELGAKRATFVTWLEEGSVAADFNIVPAWKWLLTG